MSSPPRNATPEQLAALAKFNEKFYGEKSEPYVPDGRPAVPVVGKPPVKPPIKGMDGMRGGTDKGRARGFRRDGDMKRPLPMPPQMPGMGGGRPLTQSELQGLAGYNPANGLPPGTQQAMQAPAGTSLGGKFDPSLGGSQSAPPAGGGIQGLGSAVNSGMPPPGGKMMKKGGAVKTPAKKMASGGMTSSASKRGDGIAQRGKTKGRMC